MVRSALFFVRDLVAGRLGAVILASALLAVPSVPLAAQQCPDGGGTVKADIVALDQPFFWNRLGAYQPQGMIYALKRDVVAMSGGSPGPGNARLRADKRPRPLVLRVNVGDCLKITFTNWLANAPVDQEQPATREASAHVMGMQLVGGIASDGSNVGFNASSLAAPGATEEYTYYAQREGTYMVYSTAANTGGQGNMGSLSAGLFGAVNVEPRGSEWYRSQVTRVEMDLATAKDAYGDPVITPQGHPILDYEATYPDGQFQGEPILGILDGDNNIVHSDLMAIITGPDRGPIAGGYTWNACANSWEGSGGDWGYSDNHEALRNRCEPFREFTVIFHDEIGALQAFPAFNDAVLGHTLHSVRDGFAINYGTGGIGAEILANRLGLGPMRECNDCKYEEFFLTSWAVGDPAMVVDVPANASDPANGVVATKALYPDDPSNVYHSYLSDHVKIRNLHVGKEHHIFHLHAHQWLYTPDSPGSAYLDSQAIGPGSSYTYEITYDGSGNRNKTPGDAIFHCHFYPHFAQGMWALWRIHDVFEQGTEMDADGTPAAGARALPDGEIVEGTPIPGLVPLPGMAMAPMPSDNFLGYPFYIPGEAGHRPPHPPLDLAPDGNGGHIDGGLPRHVVTGGTASMPPLNRLDFDKVNETLKVMWLDEQGTDQEKAAMDFHACDGCDQIGGYRGHPSYVQPTDGSSILSGSFLVNGLPPIAGAPFADPCMATEGWKGYTRTYKAAGFQIDATYSKSGWHFPQHRMLALNEDVLPTIDGTRTPEPFYFRANSNDCIEFHHTNLLPHVYELDDFQVKTPTDVLGQHIHLVKFDVTSSDGSANGYNYEDGTFAPGEVLERIHAIRVENLCPDGVVSDDCPEARQHPEFAGALGLGAQTTIQRWWADPVLNNDKEDRTLRTVYTHDHYAPSTQQQAGYYAGLLIEPEESTWYHAETGEQLGVGRADGGPTSWQAIVKTKDPADSYREFMLSQADFSLGYTKNANLAPSDVTDDVTGHTVHGALVDRDNAINPPARKEIGLPFLTERAPQCPGNAAPPCPEAISADDPGFMTMNYRTEPLALRVRDPNSNAQAAGVAGDLAHAFRSDVTRADWDLNQQPGFYPDLTFDLKPGDPYTPMLRAYENDKVQIRILVGAQEEGHTFVGDGLRWLFEPSWNNSGYRSAQTMGISEHFELEVPAFPDVDGAPTVKDYLVMPSAATDGLWSGVWTILRTYDGSAGLRPDLAAVPSNPKGEAPRFVNNKEFSGVCPVVTTTETYTDKRGRERTRTTRSVVGVRYSLVAVRAKDVLPQGTVYYNKENGLHDPNAILYVHENDLNKKGKLKKGVPVEPIVLRAKAGDCIDVELANRLPGAMEDHWGFSTLPMVVDYFNNNQVLPSAHVGLSALLVEQSVEEDGVNVGLNPVATVAPGGKVSYRWYAGRVLVCQGSEQSGPCKGENLGVRKAEAVEYGVVPLLSADRIKHASKGAIGALVIEPKGASWTTDDRHAYCGEDDKQYPRCSRAAATVTVKDEETGDVVETFREFVVLFQNDLNLLDGNTPVPNLAETEDPEDSGQKGFNYRTEPMWTRTNSAPDAPLTDTRLLDFSDVLSSTVHGDPATPVFMARAGDAVRFRVVHAGGHARNNVFTLHGHVWEQLPYQDGSTKLGFNEWSEWKGSQEGIGAGVGFNFLLENGAGGTDLVDGDYLYRDFQSFTFDGGLWGILRVLPNY